MNDTAPNDQGILHLPPSVISRADVARLVTELERIDNGLTANVVRTKVGGTANTIPPISRQLADFVLANKLDLTVVTTRTQLIRAVSAMKDTLPVIHLTFASEADRESLSQLVLWLRQEIHPLAVIAVGLQPGLVAGVYVRTANRVFDMSLKGALKGGRAILTNELRGLVGERI